MRELKYISLYFKYQAGVSATIIGGRMLHLCDCRILLVMTTGIVKDDRRDSGKSEILEYILCQNPRIA